MTTPLYLDVDGISCVALLDEPELAVAGAPAVLLPPPFGWEELCTYRSRYEWARDLAARGHAVLRLDLPGTGDSAGGPHEPALFDAWTAAVVAGARLLADRGAARVAAVGLGLGGLLAVRAQAEGAPIDDLVLWAVPARGRAVARELRAFARLEQSEVAAYDGTLPETHDDGRAVVAGFLLMPETLAAIEAVDLATLELGDRTGGRALLLDRDGVGPDERLAECLTAAGMAVDSGSGAGWGAMIDMPHMAVTPHDVIARADDWLGGAPASAAARSLPAPAQAEEAVVAPGVVERVVLLPSASGEVVGVAAGPEDAEPAPFVAVFLNAGAIRRIGPGRMWVAAARRWAQRGVASVRVDLIGIGDAAGDRDPRDPELGLYVPDYVAQVREVLDGLERLGHPPRFALIGLCSGAYWSLHAAVQDERVTAAVLLNPRAITTDVLRQQMSGEVTRLLSARAWSKVARGQVPIGDMAARLGRLVRVASRDVPARLRRRAGQAGDELEEILSAVEQADHRVTMLFSVGEPLPESLEMSGRWDRVSGSAQVSVERIAGHDHTLRPLVMQEAAHAVIDRALEAELQRSAAAGVAA